MNVIDIVLLVLVVLCVLLGMKKGLLRSGVELAGFVLAAPASLAASRYLAPLIYTQFLHQNLVENAVAKLDGYGDIASFVAVLQEKVNSLPFSVEMLGQKFGIDINGALSGMAAGLSNAAVAEAYVNSFLKPVFTTICTGALFCLFFILILIVVKLLAALLKNKHLPHGLKELNGALGALFGLAKGAVLVFAVCSVLGVVQIGLSLQKTPSAFSEAVSSSFLVEKVNVINPLLNE